MSQKSAASSCSAPDPTSSPPSSSAAALEQLVWLPTSKKARPGQHEWASASQEPDATPGFTPGWLPRSCFVGPGGGQEWFWEQVAVLG